MIDNFVDLYLGCFCSVLYERYYIYVLIGRSWIGGRFMIWSVGGLGDKRDVI